MLRVPGSKSRDQQELGGQIVDLLGHNTELMLLIANSGHISDFWASSNPGRRIMLANALVGGKVLFRG